MSGTVARPRQYLRCNVSFIVSQVPRGVSAVYAAQLALKYDVPVAPGLPKPSTVAALAPYVKPQPVPVQTYIAPRAPDPIPTPTLLPSMPTYIAPRAPLPSVQPAVTQPAVEAPHECTTCKRGNTATPQRVENPLIATAQSTAPAAATTSSAKVPSWLGAALTIGGAFLTSRSIV
jgi:hypothetical protein